MFFNKDFKLFEKIYADEANIENNDWLLNNVSIIKFKGNTSEEVKLKNFQINSIYTHEKIVNLFKNFETLSFIDLVINYKKLTGGYLTFKETFTVAIGISVAGAFISTFFSILLFNFIDSDFAILLKDATIEKLVYQFDNIPEGNSMYSIMESLIEETQEEDIYSISNQASGFFYSLFFHIVVSAIISAFIKKDKPFDISG